MPDGGGQYEWYAATVAGSWVNQCGAASVRVSIPTTTTVAPMTPAHQPAWVPARAWPAARLAVTPMMIGMASAARKNHPFGTSASGSESLGLRSPGELAARTRARVAIPPIVPYRRARTAPEARSRSRPEAVQVRAAAMATTLAQMAVCYPGPCAVESG
jgi:hypothetical protein